MSKVIWKSLLASPVLLGAALAFSGSAVAQEATVDSSVSVTSLEQINEYSAEGSNSVAQVTSVSQLSDVQPTDWAFQALQSLVERYGCIAGYPDGTYRGNRAMTRYEFAAGLNACLDRILEITGLGGVTEEDLATIRQLQDQFAADLAVIRGRVDSLESRVAELEANQFSTTTKLNGEVIFNVYGGGQGNEFVGLLPGGSDLDGDGAEDFGSAFYPSVFGGPDVTDLDGDGDITELVPLVGTAGDEEEVAFGYRVRLNLDTSFTGEDRLRTRLQARDQRALSSDPFGFSFGTGASNDIVLDDLFYTFPLGERAEVIIGANSLGVDDFVASTISPLDDSGGGGLNDFSGPVQYDLFDNGDVGAGAIVQLTDNLSLDFGYTAGEANDPSEGAGLFNGDYSAVGQLTYLSDFIDAGLTYVHSYAGGSTLLPGVDEVGDLFYTSGGAFLNSPRGLVGNTYAGQVNFKFGGVQVGGGISYTNAILLETGDFDVWSWNGTLAFPDLGGEGNLLGIYGGQTPNYGPALSFIDGINSLDNTYLVEAFYKYQLTDNISITPGVIWIINPFYSSDNEDTVIGSLRTTFRF
ncbi:MAG: iron uptake porin [Thainema sp.]